MRKIYSGKSDKEGYKNMTVFDDGSKVYFNDLKTTDEINRAFTECWNSLPYEKQLEINERIRRGEQCKA